MVNLSQKNIVKLANETGFIKDNIEKVLRLTDILDFLFSTKWKDKLALKGGTAINLFYVNMPRLSVDIDLDYIVEDRDTMLADKEELKEFLRSALYQKNYSLSEASKRHYALDSNVFQYINNAGNRDNIKIEINFLDRVHVLPIQESVVDLPIAQSENPIKVLSAEELYGSKIAALLGRCKPRDVYDVYSMIQKEVIKDNELLRKCAIFYNCIGGEANIDNVDYRIFDELTKRDFNRMLRPMLVKTEKFDEKQAIATIKDFLQNLLTLTDSEKQFVEKFRHQEYCPELLFDGQLLQNVKDHPMAIWRCTKQD